MLLVNTYDEGGAANACIRLHEGLLDKGVDSKLLLLYKTKQIPQTFNFRNKAHKLFLSKFFDLINKIKSTKIKKLLRFFLSDESIFLNNRNSFLESYSFPASSYDLTQSIHYQQADIINLHWVAGFLDFESFFRKNKKPIVWTFHDMNVFSGGEHYKEWYGSINMYGYPSIRIKSAEELKWDDKILEKKRNFFKNNNLLSIITPSKWLSEETRKSKIFPSTQIKTIANSLDTEIFNNYDKIACRRELNLPEDKIIILSVAQSLAKRRKGMDYLIKAMGNLDEKTNIVLCTVGDLGSNICLKNNIISLGSIRDEYILAKAYSAADVFVIPSLMDNLPNTVLESLSCGTPVISFPVGGMLDLIDNGINGFLSDEISVSSLENSILEFLSRGVKLSCADIRRDAVSKYHHNIQIKKYMAVYKSIYSK